MSPITLNLPLKNSTFASKYQWSNHWNLFSSTDSPNFLSLKPLETTSLPCLEIFKLVDQADFLSSKQYGTTFFSKDCGVDLTTPAFGDYYLQNLINALQVSKPSQCSLPQFWQFLLDVLWTYTQTLLNQMQIWWRMNTKQNSTNGSGIQIFYS